eukprot:332079-Amphidinium_carterae.1
MEVGVVLPVLSDLYLWRTPRSNCRPSIEPTVSAAQDSTASSWQGPSSIVRFQHGGRCHRPASSGRTPVL